MAEITPIHYHIYLEPDLETFKFNGKVKIELMADSEVEEVVLHSKELEIQKCQVENNGQFSDTTYQTDLAEETITIKLPSPSQSFNLHFEYVGDINDKLAGLYRSKTVIDGKEIYAAVTQFQESDARRAFPCFDVPQTKATFDIEYLIDEKYDAISNNTIKEVHSKDNGKKHVIFNRTPKMSTYLLFFGIGEFNKIETQANDVTVSVMASKQYEPLSEYGDFALDFVKKTIEFSEDYFQVKYPLPKLDNIATPDFAHGAMENWGSILYRENLLLVFPHTDTRLRRNIQMIIAHEIAHQWFGNLVSPNSWKYLWLNESFATFFGYGIVDHYYSEKKVWEYFVLGQTGVALVSDGYVETMPIEKPGDVVLGMTIKNANILYNKGGSVLRQTEAFVGKDGFRDGLRLYLKKFAYSTSSSDDLWESIEEATGKPVINLMKTWILQDGYPLITIKEDGNKLSFDQYRFTYLGVESDSEWVIPLSMMIIYHDKENETVNLTMDTRNMDYTLPDGAAGYKLNLDLTGFYRIRYPDTNLGKLGNLIQNKELNGIDRWNIIIDLYALLRARKITLDNYLKFVENYYNEDSHLSISSISTQLFSLYSLMEGETRDKISEIGKLFLESVLERINLEPQEGEDITIGTLRGDLLRNAVAFGSGKIKEFALAKFELFKNGDPVSPNILGPIISIAATETNDYDWFMNSFENAENEQISVLLAVAMGRFSDISLIEKMQIELFNKIPSRNRGTTIGAIIMNPEATSTLWHWYLANLDAFEQLHSFMYQSILTGLIPRCVEYEGEVREFLKDYVVKNPSISDAVDVALETMEINKLVKDQFS